MLETNELISQMLAPSVAISAFGLLLLSMSNRFLTITGRVRTLNAEIRELYLIKTRSNVEENRLKAVKDQVETMLRRCYIIKNSVFFLYVGLGLTVLTILTLAADLLNLSIFLDKFSILFFVLALLFMLTAIILEGFEILMALKNLNQDYINSCYEPEE
ncbi:MAG: DUF2721 domain-containing protein [Vampirovibrionia bacterium]